MFTCFRRTRALILDARPAMVSPPDLTHSRIADAERWLEQTLAVVEAACDRCVAGRYANAHPALSSAVGVLCGSIADFRHYRHQKLDLVPAISRFERTVKRLTELEFELSGAMGCPSIVAMRSMRVEQQPWIRPRSSGDMPEVSQYRDIEEGF